MTWLLPLAMAVALLVDRLLGEPPARLHPVVAMGRYLGWFRLQTWPAPLAFVGGALAWLLGAASVGLLYAWLEGWLWLQLRPQEGLARWAALALLLGLLLKPLLAWARLADEVRAVEQALTESLDAGRARLSRLVSRDVSSLSPSEVREAAIETLAENLNDSVIAPLFWFAIAGLPGAAVYRFANTADAMWGYRDAREWSGKWAARADDLLSWLPARLSALALLLPRAGLLPRLWHEARQTPSPNSGWPMAAAALRLDLSLGKAGVYRLNARGRSPQTADLEQALALCRRAMLAGAVAMALLAWWLRTGSGSLP